MTSKVAQAAQPGDVIIVEGHHVGEGRRIGEILEVLVTDSAEHYRVRWDDGHESVFYPSTDAVIRHAESSRAERT